MHCGWDLNYSLQRNFGFETEIGVFVYRDFDQVVNIDYHKIQFMRWQKLRLTIWVYVHRGCFLELDFLDP